MLKKIYKQRFVTDFGDEYLLNLLFIFGIRNRLDLLIFGYIQYLDK